MIPSCDQTGTLHFHSSTTWPSASWMRERIRARVSPRQSPSSAMRASISSEGEAPSFAFSQSLCSLIAASVSREDHLTHQGRGDVRGYAAGFFFNLRIGEAKDGEARGAQVEVAGVVVLEGDRTAVVEEGVGFDD